MPIFLILLLLGVLAYLYWQHKTTTLTRECRWRRTAQDAWRCAACGAEMESESNPTVCLKLEKGPPGKM
jgi:Tfp pilus assembly protein PilV